MTKERHFECGDLERFSDFLMSNKSLDSKMHDPNEKDVRYCGLEVIEREGIPKDTVYLVSAEGKYVQSFKI